MSAGKRRLRLRFVLRPMAAVLVLFAATAGRAEDDATPDPDGIQGRKLLWSTSIFGELDTIKSPYDDNGLGGFFDQYDYTPNPDGSVALQLGVRDASFDWLDGRAALLQFRYQSPTSNLGLTGADLDNAFFNQRALLLGRTDAFDLDVEYRRLRTEPLRVYPETVAGGGALPFTDLTGQNDRFYRERTGFEAELRWRPDRSLDLPPSDLAPELSFRGGYDRRESQIQQRMILNPGNDWLAFTDKRGDDVGDVGAGVLVVPGGLFTLTFDADYQEFKSDNARLDDTFPFTSTSRSVAFVPSTERGTGQAFVHGRFGDRAVVTAGFQATVLKQKSPYTPAESAANFDDNEVRVYSAQMSGDVRLTSDVSANAFVKYVYRDNGLDRSTALYNPDNGTQVDELLENFQRLDAGAETRWRATPRTNLAFGTKLLWIDRHLSFPALGVGNRVIQPENALVHDKTQMWTFYARADLRPLQTLGLRSELSYRIAPDTGYVTDLDGYFRGEIRATYTLPVTRPATLSAYARGGIGENSDFSMVEGLGPNPPGPSVDRNYKRSDWSLGLSGDLAWSKDLTFFSSVSFARDTQKDDLLLSNLQRYFQEAVPITFRSAGTLELNNDELEVLIGSRFAISKQSDVAIAGSYTRATADYGESANSQPLALIDDNRVVDANIYGLDIGIQHRIRAGLRIFAGYRLQYYSDGAPKPDSPSSVQQPPDRSDLRNTVTLGVTLDSELLDHRR